MLGLASPGVSAPAGRNRADRCPNGALPGPRQPEEAHRPRTSINVHRAHGLTTVAHSSRHASVHRLWTGRLFGGPRVPWWFCPVSPVAFSPLGIRVQVSAQATANLVAAAREAGVRDPRVLDAVRAVPRASFVPPEHVRFAYDDEPIPIPHHQVTTQPSLSALMVQALRLSGDEQVLEVGTGYGYQTALLARLAAFVTSIEIWPDLAAQAWRNLVAERVHNVRVLAGDGSEGVPDHAPYDAVLVSAAFPQVPAPLVAQLRVGGRLVQPIGPGGDDQVVLFEHTPDGLVAVQSVVPARFVRLYGSHGYR